MMRKLCFVLSSISFWTNYYFAHSQTEDICLLPICLTPEEAGKRYGASELLIKPTTDCGLLEIANRARGEMAEELELGLQDKIQIKDGWTASSQYAHSRDSTESEAISETLSPEELNDETLLIFEQNPARASESPADQQPDLQFTPSTGALTTLPSIAQLALPSPGAAPTILDDAWTEPRLPTLPEPRTIPCYADLAISLRDPPPLVHLSHLNDSTTRDRVLPALVDPSPLTSESAPLPSLRAYPPGAAVLPSRELPILLKDRDQRPSDVLPQRPFENQDLNHAATLGVQAMNERRYMPTTPMRRVFRLEDESFVQLCQRAKSETSASVEESSLKAAHGRTFIEEIS